MTWHCTPLRRTCDVGTAVAVLATPWSASPASLSAAPSRAPWSAPNRCAATARRGDCRQLQLRPRHSFHPLHAPHQLGGTPVVGDGARLGQVLVDLLTDERAAGHAHRPRGAAVRTAAAHRRLTANALLEDRQACAEAGRDEVTRARRGAAAALAALLATDAVRDAARAAEHARHRTPATAVTGVTPAAARSASRRPAAAA